MSKEKSDEHVRKEVRFFDSITMETYKDVSAQELVYEKDNLNSYLNVTSIPLTPYRFAIYRLLEFKKESNKVLVIAAGTCNESVILAKQGWNTFNFDVSWESIKVGKARAKANNVLGKVKTQVTSVYEMSIKNETFHVVYGNAVLHHFDLKTAFAEINRVLKKNGVAIFVEPYSGSKVLRQIRMMIPLAKAPCSEDENPLGDQDIETILKFFPHHEIQKFEMLGRVGMITKNKFVLNPIYCLDRFLLKYFKFLRRFAGSVVLILKK